MFLQNIVNHKLLDIIVHQVTSLIFRNRCCRLR